MSLGRFASISDGASVANVGVRVGTMLGWHCSDFEYQTLGEVLLIRIVYRAKEQNTINHFKSTSLSLGCFQNVTQAWGATPAIMDLLLVSPVSGLSARCLMQVSLLGSRHAQGRRGQHVAEAPCAVCSALKGCSMQKLRLHGKGLMRMRRQTCRRGGRNRE